MISLIFTIIFFLWVTFQVFPADIGDFDRLLRYYGTEEGSFYVKYLEFSSKAYFSKIPPILDSKHIFRSLSVTLCYLPLILLVVKKGSNLNKGITILGLLFFLDIGHSLQFFRTYLSINIIILGWTYSSFFRSALLIMATTIHQGVGLIFLSHSIIKRISLIFILITLFGLYYLLPTDFFDHLSHSLWIVRTDYTYVKLHILYLPIMVTVLSIQIILIIIARDTMLIVFFIAMVLSIILSINGIFSELLLRVNFYAVEILFSLQFIFLKKRFTID